MVVGEGSVIEFWLFIYSLNDYKSNLSTAIEYLLHLMANDQISKCQKCRNKMTVEMVGNIQLVNIATRIVR